MTRTKLSQENYRPISFIMFIKISVQSLSSVHVSRSVVSDSVIPWSAACQASLYMLGACSNSCPSSWWCHPIISSSVVPFSCLQSCPESRSFPMSQFLASGGQSIGVSASASVLSMNIQDWFPLGLAGWILQSKGLSRLFSNNTVQKHQFFHAQLSLWSNSHRYVNVTTEETIALTRRTFDGKVMSLLFNMLSRLVITFLPRSTSVF